MARGPQPDPKSDRLGDRLGVLAKQKPVGGRPKWIVWGVVGGAVFVIGMLQAFGVTTSPVADRVLEGRRASEKPPADPPKTPSPAPPEGVLPAPVPPPAAPGQGTTK